MEPVIKVENLAKSYIISHQSDAQYSTLKDDLAKVIKKPFGGKAQTTQENFWALKDISFEVNAGEVFGIVGRNGSGKSTLLKILSRIVEPTKGRATLHGRTASLLEVGTGFHPELTGRENIYFNGSMLGMSKQEITKKFDEIVAFSEVERFIDTPVKFYSSGMYVRLAFSVAAHLESEILILDEVLSVGDAAFQKKSLAKILQSMEEGRTVLFVSHSMGSVQQLCTRGLLLKNGIVEYLGGVDELADRYMAIMREEGEEGKLTSTWKNDGSVDNEHFVPIKIHIEDEDGKKVSRPVKNDKPHYVVIEANIKQASDLLTFGYGIYNQNKTLMYFSFPTDSPKEDWPKYKNGHVLMRGEIPPHLLNAGRYKVGIVGRIILGK